MKIINKSFNKFELYFIILVKYFEYQRNMFQYEKD